MGNETTTVLKVEDDEDVELCALRKSLRDAGQVSPRYCARSCARTELARERDSMLRDDGTLTAARRRNDSLWETLVNRVPAQSTSGLQIVIGAQRGGRVVLPYVVWTSTTLYEHHSLATVVGEPSLHGPMKSQTSTVYNRTHLRGR